MSPRRPSHPSRPSCSAERLWDFATLREGRVEGPPGAWLDLLLALLLVLGLVAKSLRLTQEVCLSWGLESPVVGLVFFLHSFLQPKLF